MSMRIVVIAEADADRRHVCELVDRQIKAHAPDWWDEEQIEHEREWCGLEPGTLFTPWKRLKEFRTRKYALRQSGFIGFDGSPSPRHHYDYPTARIALTNCFLATPRPDAVLLVRDMDQQPKRRAESIRAAAAEFPALTVALALPVAKREAWVLNGFVADGDTESGRYRQASAEFSFDLCARAEKLDAMEHGAKRDAKRVLRAVMDEEREPACWMETDWTVLRRNGMGTGLSQFLEDVKNVLVPMVAGQTRV